MGPQPDDYLLCVLINLSHHSNLLGALFQIALVNANGIHPEVAQSFGLPRTVIRTDSFNARSRTLGAELF
jgi:hypothetical protein